MSFIKMESYMAFDKKPTVYRDRGIIGSSQELDAYGVWVKSEPQDLSANLASAVGFGDETIPYHTDFDTFNEELDIEPESDFNISSFEDDDTSIDLEAFNSIDMEEETIESSDYHEEASNQLLTKIADELSSIRLELKTLKKEFAEIKSTSDLGLKESELAVSPEEKPDKVGFFSGIDDEKITLTDDEMDNIFSSSEFTEHTFDPLRDEDEAALERISKSNEAAADAESTDIDEISIPDPLNEIDEMHNLRIEGATPLNEAPENSKYLEDDPFSFSETDLEDISLGGNDLVMNFNNDELDLNINDLAMEVPNPIEDEIIEDSFDLSSLDIPNAVMEESDLLSEIEEHPLEEPTLEEPTLEEPVFEDMELDNLTLDIENFDINSALQPNNSSIDQVIPEAYEAKNTASASFDDDLEVFSEDLSLTDVDLDLSESFDLSLSDTPPIKTIQEGDFDLSAGMKKELKNILSYMDHLLESLPEEKIEEFAKSEYYNSYKKLFKELGLV